MRFDLLAFVRRYRYPLAAGALIACAVAVRLALIVVGWPHTNSEEGTMGLEALHIFQRREHPIYFYGQNYMGADEAYLGALAFWIFGVSLVSLRLGMALLYALFLLGVWWLAHLLYGRRVALVSLALLIFGTPFLLKIELQADGGKAETLAFGALMFALATWLAYTSPQGAEESAPPRQRGQRGAAFVAWGIVAGLGLFTYAIAAPFVLTSAILLVGGCRRELRGWRWALPLAGLLIGMIPVFIYTVNAPLEQNPVAVFLSLHQSLNTGGVSGVALLAKQLVGTLLFTLPTVTGLLTPYPIQAMPLFGPPSAATIVAVIVGGGWSAVYLALLGVATYRPFMELRKGKLTDTADNARHLARLLLAAAAWLTIATYLFSATAANNPNSGRYMIGLLIAVPAVLWPLLERSPRATGSRWPWRPIALALLAGSLLLGIVGSVVGMTQAIPPDLAADQTDTVFAQELLDHGITRFYGDYWTCDLLTFATKERLICAVVNDYGKPGLTRYAPYAAAVQADPSAPYVLARGSEIERTFLAQAAANHQQYTVTYRLGRYNVYALTSP